MARAATAMAIAGDSASVAAGWILEAGFTVIFAGAETDLLGSGAFCKWTVACGKGLTPAVLGGTLAVSFLDTGLSGAGAMGAAGACAGAAGMGAAGLAKPGAAGVGDVAGAEGAAGVGATGPGEDGGFGSVEGGLGSPPGAGGVSPDGGLGGAMGAAPGAVGGLGGRFNITFSRGVLEPGVPSLRGGKTIRTVSFFGSDMAGWILDGVCLGQETQES